MDKPLELGAVFRLTRSGRQFDHQTGVINAAEFDRLPFDSSYILTAFMGADEDNYEEVRVVAQQSTLTNLIQQDIRIDEMETYYRNHWIARVDVGRPEETFPMRSVWKLKGEGAADGSVPRDLVPRFDRYPTHNWMVMAVWLDIRRHMAQMITLVDKTTVNDDNVEFRQKLRLDMVYDWFLKGWIERVDVAHIDVDTDVDDMDDTMPQNLSVSMNQYIIDKPEP